MRLFAAVAALACVVATQTTTWGGDHIEIATNERGARVEFDCAHGTIDAPLAPDARGAFRADGSFTPEGAGPSRDEGPKPLKATYSGTIDGDAMELRLDIDGQDQPRRFTLTRGQRGNLRTCR